jgi:spore maturation protein CgeB
VNLVYSFNKRGREAEIWQSEIEAASSEACRFIPFNHDPYLNPQRYVRAQLLDELYFRKDAGLLKLYDDVRRLIERLGANVLVVDNFHPYHPEFLKGLGVYKVIRLGDGPISAYDRDFAYIHAYDHVLFHSPGYSEHLTMPEKLAFLGAKRFDLWPLALFDSAFDHNRSKESIFSSQRDIDVIFIGALHFEKMPVLARLKKALGRRLKIHGLANWKRNVYFNVKFGFPGWITEIEFSQYVPLYLRSKIGINLHNRGKFGVGNYRLFELPANGVLQISDGGEYLKHFFKPDVEIVRCDDFESILAKVDYFLSHEKERIEIVKASYDAVLQRHRFNRRMQELVELLQPYVSTGAQAHQNARINL